MFILNFLKLSQGLQLGHGGEAGGLNLGVGVSGCVLDNLAHAPRKDSPVGLMYSVHPF